MSYVRHFSKQVSVHYSGNVPYPASQNGGTASYSGTAYETIDVNISVDTNPFDASINSCNNSVNVLSGAVVATEAAQIASINNNAKKVGSTIVEGFFKTIRSEISQQIMELSVRLDATLIHLHEMAKRCVEKQKQMETDYNGIASRYSRIFGDLNSELSNRIYELDKPVFIFKQQSDGQNIRTSENDLVSTVTVFGAEEGELQARISASFAKKRALETIGKANIFLLKQRKLDETIIQRMLKNSITAALYLPVCFIEMQNEKNQIDKNVYQADFSPKMKANELISDFQRITWSAFPKDISNQIGRYLNAEISNHYPGADTHNYRIRENIIKMLNFNQMKSV